MATQLATAPPREQSIVTTVAERYGMAAGRFVQALRATVVPTECDDAQLAAFLVVCNEYGLNPLTKEIYAFPSKGRVTPMVSIDGWISLINRHPAMDGMDFQDIPGPDGKLLAIECTIFRKDRSRPIKVIEYLSECKGTTGPWTKSPARMLRHRALIQCGRYAFGFSGVSVEGHDEIIDGGTIQPMRDATPPRRLNAITRGDREDAENAAEIEAKAKGVEPDYAAVDALFADVDDTAEADDAAVDPDTGEIVDEKRDAAAGWVARTVLAINGAADREALAVVQTKRTKALGDVREAYPDLAEQVDAAFAAKLAGFDAADDAGVE